MPSVFCKKPNLEGHSFFCAEAPHLKLNNAFLTFFDAYETLSNEFGDDFYSYYNKGISQELVDDASRMEKTEKDWLTVGIKLGNIDSSGIYFCDKYVVIKRIFMKI